METTKPKATTQIVRNYQELFVNRRAYTMQSLRPHPETGRHYYFRPSQKGTDVPLMLTDSTIRQHLEGEITIGLYAINPSTQRCKWVDIDADYNGRLTKAPIPPDSGWSAAGAGNEQARRASLDLPGNASVVLLIAYTAQMVRNWFTHALENVVGSSRQRRSRPILQCDASHH